MGCVWNSVWFQFFHSSDATDIPRVISLSSCSQSIALFLLLLSQECRQILSEREMEAAHLCLVFIYNGSWILSVAKMTSGGLRVYVDGNQKQDKKLSNHLLDNSTECKR